MRRWRLLQSLMAGLLLSICLACNPLRSSTSTASPAAPQVTPAAPTASIPTASAPTASAPTLPPATQTLLSRLGTPENPPRGNVRLAVISDLNSAYGSTSYEPEVTTGIQLLPFWQPDLVLCAGDMVAGQKPSLTVAQLQAMWAAFDQTVAAPLRQFSLPLGFTIGNHDASSAMGIGGQFLFQQERDLAHRYWNDPEHDSGIQFVDRFEFPFYYSFKYRDIFFLSWDGSSSRIPDHKLAWVEQALASPEAQQAKLRIVIGHLPLYGIAVGRDEPGEVMDQADSLRALLEKYQVHTYISGHHHAYYPAHKGQLQLLHTGILGSGPRPLIAGEAAPRKTLTLVDINFDTPELTSYTTFDMKTLKPVPLNELPQSLMGHNGMVLRRDVQRLNAETQHRCEQQLDLVRCTA
jgi:Calcineurin-like phosphoesterase